MVEEQPLGMPAASLRRTPHGSTCGTPGGGRAVQREAVDRTPPERRTSDHSGCPSVQTGTLLVKCLLDLVPGGRQRGLERLSGGG